METLQLAMNLITRPCYMTSVDLKDAYHNASVAQHHKKYLRFVWRGQLWQFNSMPNRLALAPRKTELRAAKANYNLSTRHCQNSDGDLNKLNALK